MSQRLFVKLERVRAAVLKGTWLLNQVVYAVWKLKSEKARTLASTLKVSHSLSTIWTCFDSHQEIIVSKQMSIIHD